VTAFVTYSHVGEHTRISRGCSCWGTTDTLDFGVVEPYGENWELRVQGTNVTNELGLTESDRGSSAWPPAYQSLTVVRERLRPSSRH